MDSSPGAPARAVLPGVVPSRAAAAADVSSLALINFLSFRDPRQLLQGLHRKSTKPELGKMPTLPPPLINVKRKRQPCLQPK